LRSACAILEAWPSCKKGLWLSHHFCVASMTDGLLTKTRKICAHSVERIRPYYTDRHSARGSIAICSTTTTHSQLFVRRAASDQCREGILPAVGRDRARHHWRHRSSARACIGLLRIDPAVGARHFDRHISKENAQGAAVCRGVVIERDKKRAGFPVVCPIRHQELGPFLRARSAAVVDNLLDPVVSTDV